MPVLLRALLIVSILTAAAAEAAPVTGTVTESGSGAPLAGKIVAAYDATGALRATGTTDATGLYVLNLTPGSYRLLAYDLDGVYATMFDSDAESFESSPLRNIPASGATVSFALVRGGSITGSVRSASGAPLAGVVVEAYNLSGTRRGFTTTDNSGNFSLVLPPRSYKLVAYDTAGFLAPAFYFGARSFADATPVRVDEGVPSSVVFTLGVAARVNGTAVDAATNAPLASILVYAYTPAGALVAATTTDLSGQFRFSLPGGDYRFVAADGTGTYAPAYYQDSRSFEGSRVIAIAAGEQRGDVRIALARGSRIRGHVNAPNLTVAAYNLDGTLHASTTSDSAGQYTLVVAPGDYRIGVSDLSGTYAARFYAASSDFRFAQVVVATSDVGGIDVTLPPGVRVSGTVRDAGGLPLSGMTVVAYDEAGTPAGSATTGNDGRYSLVLAAGSYRLLAFDPQLGYATSYAGGASSYETTAPLVVVAAATLTSDFTMRPGVRVSGTVTTDRGTALDGIEIFALDANGNRAAGATSTGGTFQVVVRPGTYRFIAVDPNRRYAPSQPSAEVTISEGQAPPAIALTLATSSRRRSVRH